MKDNFSGQAAEYARYRPVYPRLLYDFLASHTPMKKAAWDCGTGNGQCAKSLSEYFVDVYATDISQQQISNAIKAPNIHYSIQPAESTHFSENSFDLVTVAQALHWFRFDEFYRELMRVAKPGAIFASWSYSLLRITPEIDKLVSGYHFNTLRDYWDAERRYVDEGYMTIPFPFEKMETPGFVMEHHWSLKDLEGYLTTWSAFQKYMLVNHQSPLEELMANIKVFWKGERMRIEFPLHLLMARIKK